MRICASIFFGTITTLGEPFIIGRQSRSQECVSVFIPGVASRDLRQACEEFFVLVYTLNIVNAHGIPIFVPGDVKFTLRAGDTSYVCAVLQVVIPPQGVAIVINLRRLCQLLRVGYRNREIRFPIFIPAISLNLLNKEIHALQNSANHLKLHMNLSFRVNWTNSYHKGAAIAVFSIVVASDQAGLGKLMVDSFIGKGATVNTLTAKIASNKSTASRLLPNFLNKLFALIANAFLTGGHDSKIFDSLRQKMAPKFDDDFFFVVAIVINRLWPHESFHSTHAAHATHTTHTSKIKLLMLSLWLLNIAK